MWIFGANHYANKLPKQFGIKSFSAFGLSGDVTLEASGALMDHDDLPNIYKVDRAVLAEATYITEALVNLNYLIGHSAGHPDMVRSYSAQAEERLQALNNLLRSVLQG